MRGDNSDDLLTTKQVAAWLGDHIDKRAATLIAAGAGNKRSMVLAWLFERECASTAEYRTVSKTSRRGRTNGRRTLR
jgi:hypothetical protein